MSKPHSSPEPSMEDILASIRKMISEDPSGQRPMPDQMARTPYGGDLNPAVQEPDPWGVEPAPSIDPSLAPSFSSLSEALKSSPPAGERRSLEERIAGLIETEQPDDAPIAPRPDPLSSFTARSAPTPAGPSEPAPRTPASSPGSFETQRSTLPRSPAPQSGPLRNGADPHPVSRQSDLGETVPQRGDALSSSRTSAKPAAADAPLPFGTRSESQRVITIPSRGPSAPASGLNGAGPGPEAKNGTSSNGASSVSAFGVRPASPALSPVTRSLQERLKEKKPVEPPASEPKPVSEAKVADKPAPDDAVPASTPTKPDLGSLAGTSPFAPTKPTSGPETSAKPSDSVLGAMASAVGGGSAPSEALLDAVVDLVQKDPSSMSVFTSGSAFIHGVGDKPSDPVPQQLVPVPGQKLDGAAAELLRPMLRQWLAENMPRIVEEALRSELTSSEAAEKDPKKS